ncbi:hypothetical protein E2C01_081560 [Portunus trituberculatus]|uniref:Uncharacterized protein n=1 Tax=Portunus trituberculatus TaxID=210409 RepID=A0A5B7J2M8_PORTR|nr:hypothetical protein [Portunus trituberculatus]
MKNQRTLKTDDDETGIGFSRFPLSSSSSSFSSLSPSSSSFSSSLCFPSRSQRLVSGSGIAFVTD